MFTGIIEKIGTIESIEYEQSNIHFVVKSDLAHELKIDQSVAHDGVCLTVVKTEGDRYTVTAVKETIDVTMLGQWKVGTEVNLERCMVANGRFDGHIVQGHVDTVATIQEISDQGGSFLFTFKVNIDTQNNTFLAVDKGSITINGVSLTCFSVGDDNFQVAIIPFTYQHTNFKSFGVGDKVNLEFDIIGKYVKRLVI